MGSSRHRSRRSRRYHRSTTRKRKSYAAILKMLKAIVDQNKRTNPASLRQSVRNIVAVDTSLQRITADMERAASELAEQNKAVAHVEASIMELIENAKLANAAEEARIKELINQGKERLAAQVEESKAAAAKVVEISKSVSNYDVPAEATGYFARLKRGVKDIYTNHGKSIAAAVVVMGAATAMYYYSRSGEVPKEQQTLVNAQIKSEKAALLTPLPEVAKEEILKAKEAAEEIAVLQTAAKGTPDPLRAKAYEQLMGIKNRTADITRREADLTLAQQRAAGLQRQREAVYRAEMDNIPFLETKGSRAAANEVLASSGNLDRLAASKAGEDVYAATNAALKAARAAKAAKLAALKGNGGH